MEGIRDWLQQKVQRLREKGILREKRSEHTIWWTEKDKEISFLENGRKLLEELMSSSNGRCNPIRSFSAQQLHNATNGFDQFESYCHSTDFDWYKGTLDHGRRVLIKCYRDDTIEYDKANGGPYRDIVISSLMSSHKNVLKLLGCCLEFPDPVLVYEYAEIGPLNSWGGTNTNIESKRLLSWKTRLKVAKGVANALTYLHGAFSRPIIHRNIKPQTVMLDENFVAKLCDFSWSILIPQGEMVAKDEIVGSLGFVDPAYFGTGCVAEQTDVYGFGVFMIVLITGRNACDLSLPENSTNICSYVNHMVEQNCVTQIIDPKILEEEGGVNQERQLHAFLGLALKCTQIKREDRPLMIQLTKQLCQIENLKQ